MVLYAHIKDIFFSKYFLDFNTKLECTFFVNYTRQCSIAFVAILKNVPIILPSEQFSYFSVLVKAQTTVQTTEIKK